jgi:hypothetical protein
MTPTLLGRWQTRLLLLATVGSGVTVLFLWRYANTGVNLPFFWVLGYVALLGLGWDAVYHKIQQYRWDHDWPALLQLAAGIWEGLVLAIAFKTIGLPGLDRTMPIDIFVWHYSIVWLGFFTVSQSLMRIIFPRWRFRGGQWWGRF